MIISADVENYLTKSNTNTQQQNLSETKNSLECPQLDKEQL